MGLISAYKAKGENLLADLLPEKMLSVVLGRGLITANKQTGLRME